MVHVGRFCVLLDPRRFTHAVFTICHVRNRFKRNDDVQTLELEPKSTRVFLIAFAAILFSDWADVGQIMAATLTAWYQAPLEVWLGATLALITKGLLALAVGRSLRQRIPLYILRPVSASLCVLMGVISALTPVFTVQAR